MLVITHRQKQFRQGWMLYEEEKKQRRSERQEEMQKWQSKVCGQIECLRHEINEKVDVKDHKTVALKVDDYGDRIIVLEVKVKDIRGKIGTERTD